MTPTSLFRWLLSVAVFVAVTAAAFIPILFVVAETPLHDGSDWPSAVVLRVSGIASVGVGLLAARLLRRRLHGSKPAAGS